jgi:competence ComEA-like helix-hairpin-helix protein
MKDFDLNTMSKEDLQELEGINPRLAEEIIKFRDERGGIEDIEELREIDGVDDSTLELIRSAGEGGESRAGSDRSRQSRGGDAYGSGGERGR